MFLSLFFSVDQFKYNTRKMTPSNELNRFLFKPYIKKSNKLDKQLRSVQSYIYICKPMY